MARKRSSLLRLAHRKPRFWRGVIHTWAGPVRTRDCGDHMLLLHPDGEIESIPIKQPTLEQILGKEEAAKVRAAQKKPQVVRYYGINGRVLGCLK